MQVQFVGVTAVSDRGERLAAPHDVAHLDRDAALLEVAHQHVATVADVHHQIVGVVTVGTGRSVGVAVGHLDDPSVGRRQHWRPEAGVLGKRGASTSRVGSPAGPQPPGVEGVTLVRGVAVEQDAAARPRHHYRRHVCPTVEMPEGERAQGSGVHAPYVDQILAVTDAVCEQHLGSEYAELCRRVVGRLARKRPSPLVRGDLRIWAAGVVYAVGQVNFIFDPAQNPHATVDQLSSWLDVKKTTMANKAAMVRDLLKLSHHDTEIMRQHLIDSNPLTWLLEVDGLLVDARHLPPGLQHEAFRLGLIPYIPGQGDAP